MERWVLVAALTSWACGAPCTIEQAAKDIGGSGAVDCNGFSLEVDGRGYGQSACYAGAFFEEKAFVGWHDGAGMAGDRERNVYELHACLYACTPEGVGPRISRQRCEDPSISDRQIVCARMGPFEPVCE